MGGKSGQSEKKTVRARVKKILENSISVKNGGREASARHCLGKDKEVCEKSEGICDMGIVPSHNGRKSKKENDWKGLRAV